LPLYRFLNAVQRFFKYGTTFYGVFLCRFFYKMCLFYQLKNRKAYAMITIRKPPARKCPQTHEELAVKALMRHVRQELMK
jgi:hypothetical protein